MSDANLISMIGNLSQSLRPVESLIAGLGYLIGIVFIISGLTKLKKIGDAKANSSSQEHPHVPILLFIIGAVLLFLPSTLSVISNSAFGAGNILQYIQYKPFDVYSSMTIVIQTAGLVWFVRGCVLLVHGGEPGAKEGPKGLTFILAGVFAMNFEATYGILNYFMNHLLNLKSAGQPGSGS